MRFDGTKKLTRTCKAAGTKEAQQVSLFPLLSPKHLEAASH